MYISYEPLILLMNFELIKQAKVPEPLNCFSGFLPMPIVKEWSFYRHGDLIWQYATSCTFRTDPRMQVNSDLR